MRSRRSPDRLRKSWHGQRASRMSVSSMMVTPDRANCSKPSASSPSAAAENPSVWYQDPLRPRYTPSSSTPAPALANSVSRAPYSMTPRAPVTVRVDMSITPPTASEPQMVLFDPRSTSNRLAVPFSTLPKSKPPAGEAGSDTRTPSTSTSTCSALAPRMLTLVSDPALPLREAVRPGTRRRARKRIGTLDQGQFVFIDDGDGLSGIIDGGADPVGSDCNRDHPFVPENDLLSGFVCRRFGSLILCSDDLCQCLLAYILRMRGHAQRRGAQEQYGITHKNLRS